MKTLTKHEALVKETRQELLAQHPFYGHLALHVEEVITDSTETLNTNGTVLQINGAFFEGLKAYEKRFALAHEYLHDGLGHPFRLQGRDPRLANIAADHVVNLILAEDGFKLIPGVHANPRFKGMCFEQVYAILEQDERNNGGKPTPDTEQKGQCPTGTIQAPSKKQGKPGDGQGQGQGDDSNQPPQDGEGGKGRKAGTGSDSSSPSALTEDDWSIIMSQARQQADKKNQLSEALRRGIEESKKGRTDWKGPLARFVRRNLPSSYTWTRPNKRFVSQGIILPGRKKENMPEIVIVVDTSGSISNKILEVFSAQCTQIMHDTKPKAIHVIYCDSAVRGMETFERFETDKITLKPMGGGGTAFQPAFDYIAQQGIDPVCAIYLTDLLGPQPSEPPYPVLWAVPEHSRKEGWFGETIHVSCF